MTSVDQTKVETVDSGILEHLLEQINEVQTDLELIIGELIPTRHEGKPLPEAISLDKVLRKLKFTLTQMISKHHKLMELMPTVKDDDTSSDHSGPTKANAVSINLPKLSISKFDGDVLNWRTIWEQFKDLIHDKEQLSDAEKLAYLKDALRCILIICVRVKFSFLRTLSKLIASGNGLPSCLVGVNSSDDYFQIRLEFVDLFQQVFQNATVYGLTLRLVDTLVNNPFMLRPVRT